MADRVLNVIEQQLAASLFAQTEEEIKKIADPAKKQAAEEAIASVKRILDDNIISDAEVTQLKEAAKKIPGAESLNGWLDNPENAAEQQKLKDKNLNPQDPMQGLMMMIFSLIAQMLGLDPAALGLNQDTAPAVEAAAAQALAATLPAVDPAAPATPAFNATTEVAGLGIGKLPRLDEMELKPISQERTLPENATNEEKAIEYYTANKNAERLGIIKEEGSYYWGADNYPATDFNGNSIPLRNFWGNDGYQQSYKENQLNRQDFSDYTPAPVQEEFNRIGGELTKLDPKIKEEAKRQVDAEIRAATAGKKIPEGFDQKTLEAKTAENSAEITANETALKKALESKEKELEKIGNCRSAQELAKLTFDSPGYGQTVGENIPFTGRKGSHEHKKELASKCMKENKALELDARVELAKYMKEEQELVAKRLELIKEQAVLAEKQARADAPFKFNGKDMPLKDAYTEIEKAEKATAEAKKLAEIAKQINTEPKTEAAPASQSSASEVPSNNSHVGIQNKLGLELAEIEARKEALIAQRKSTRLTADKEEINLTIRELTVEIDAKKAEIVDVKLQANSTPEKVTDNYIDSLYKELKPLETEQRKLKLEIGRNAGNTEAKDAYKEVEEKIQSLRKTIEDVKKTKADIVELATLPAIITAKTAEVELLTKQIDTVNKTKTDLAKIADAIIRADKTLDKFNNPKSLEGTGNEEAVMALKLELDTLKVEAAKAGAKTVADKLGAVTEVIKKAVDGDKNITADEMTAIKDALAKSGVKSADQINALIDADQPNLEAKKKTLGEEVGALNLRMDTLKESTNKAVQNYTPDNRPTPTERKL